MRAFPTLGIGWNSNLNFGRTNPSGCSKDHHGGTVRNAGVWEITDHTLHTSLLNYGVGSFICIFTYDHCHVATSAIKMWPNLKLKISMEGKLAAMHGVLFPCRRAVSLAGQGQFGCFCSVLTLAIQKQCPSVCCDSWRTAGPAESPNWLGCLLIMFLILNNKTPTSALRDASSCYVIGQLYHISEIHSTSTCYMTNILLEPDLPKDKFHLPWSWPWYCRKGMIGTPARFIKPSDKS